MPAFEYSRWDGSQQFSPQSADKLFDELSQYLMDYGEDVLDSLQQWDEEHPDVLEKLIQRGLVERDQEGKFVVTPKGLRRVENKALEALFDVRGRDKLGRHDTEFRGAGQTVHEESKPYEFGDPVSNLNLHETLKNALSRENRERGNFEFSISDSQSKIQIPNSKIPSRVDITEDDLVVYDTEYQTACATVVLLDMSGSMARYGSSGRPSAWRWRCRRWCGPVISRTGCRWWASTRMPARSTNGNCCMRHPNR